MFLRPSDEGTREIIDNNWDSTLSSFHYLPQVRVRFFFLQQNIGAGSFRVSLFIE